MMLATAAAAPLPTGPTSLRESFAPGSNGSRRVTFEILRSGVLAQEFCRHVKCAEVVAVFERACYLRSDDVFVCIGAPAIGNGPLALIADIGDRIALTGLGLRCGQTASISDRCIAIGSAIRFTRERCEPWRPPPWPAVQSPLPMTDSSAALLHDAGIGASSSGIRWAVRRAQEQLMHRSPLPRIARSRLASFESWLTDVLNPDHAHSNISREPVERMIGLGPGLTPSGDDFLIGTLAMLDAIGQQRARTLLARVIADASPALTSPLSYCFLKAAVGGHFGEPLCRAVSFVVTGNVEAAIAALRAIGHSSGWDMLAGIAMALRLATAGLPPGDPDRQDGRR